MQAAEVSVAFDPARALSIGQARQRMRGRAGRHPHAETVRRYMTRGATIPGGHRVKLKSVKIGQERLTMPEWVDEFERQRLLGGMG